LKRAPTPVTIKCKFNLIGNCKKKIKCTTQASSLSVKSIRFWVL